MVSHSPIFDTLGQRLLKPNCLEHDGFYYFSSLYPYLSVEEKVKGVMVRRNILDIENFKHILTAFGDKLNEDEIEDIFGEFDFDDDGNIFTKVCVN